MASFPARAAGAPACLDAAGVAAVEQSLESSPSEFSDSCSSDEQNDDHVASSVSLSSASAFACASAATSTAAQAGGAGGTGGTTAPRQDMM